MFIFTVLALLFLFVQQSLQTREIILDLGAAFFKVGTLQQGAGNIIDMILNSQSKRLTSTSVVYDGEVYFVGEYASNGLKRQFSNTAREGKEFIHSLLADEELENSDGHMTPATLVSAVITHIRTRMLGLNMEETFTPEEMQAQKLKQQFMPQGMKLYKNRNGGMVYRSSPGKEEEAKEEHVNVTLVVPTGATHEEILTLRAAIESVPNTHLVGVVNSAAAIAVSYMSGRINYLREQTLPYSENVLVVDIGAGTSEISAVEIYAYDKEIENSNSKDKKNNKDKKNAANKKKNVDVTLLSSNKFGVGGNDVTDKMVELCIEHILVLALEKVGIPLVDKNMYEINFENKFILTRMNESADKAKRILAVNPETNIYVENVVVNIVNGATSEIISEGIDLDDVLFTYSREMLDHIVEVLYRDQLEDTFTQFAQWLQNNNKFNNEKEDNKEKEKETQNNETKEEENDSNSVELKSIDVLLFGGGSRIVSLQTLIEDTLATAIKPLGYKPNIQKTVNADEAAVMGAGFVTAKGIRGIRLMYQFSAYDLPYEQRTSIETSWIVPAEEIKEEVNGEEKITKIEEDIIITSRTNNIKANEKYYKRIDTRDVLTPLSKILYQPDHEVKSYEARERLQKALGTEEGAILKMSLYDGENHVSTRICRVNTKYDADYNITRPPQEVLINDTEQEKNNETDEKPKEPEKKQRTPIADLLYVERQQSLVSRFSADVYGDINLHNVAILASIPNDKKSKDKEKDVEESIRHLNIIKCEETIYNTHNDLKAFSDRTYNMMVDSYNVLTQRHELEEALNSLEMEVYSAASLIEENYDKSYEPIYTEEEVEVERKEQDTNSEENKEDKKEENDKPEASEIPSIEKNIEKRKIETTDVLIRHSEFEEIDSVLKEVSKVADDMVYVMDPCGPHKECVAERVKMAKGALDKINKAISPIKIRKNEKECRPDAIEKYNDALNYIQKRVKENSEVVNDKGFVETWSHRCALVTADAERFELEKEQKRLEEEALLAKAEAEASTENTEEIIDENKDASEQDVSQESKEKEDEPVNEEEKKEKKNWFKNIFSRKSKEENEKTAEEKKETEEDAKKAEDKEEQALDTAKKLCKRIEDDYQKFNENFELITSKEKMEKFLNDLDNEPKMRPKTTCKTIEEEAGKLKSQLLSESNRIKRDIEIDSKVITRNEHVSKLVQEENRLIKLSQEAEKKLAEAEAAEKEKKTEEEPQLADKPIVNGNDENKNETEKTEKEQTNDNLSDINNENTDKNENKDEQNKDEL